jgi:hypothetical protein
MRNKFYKIFKGTYLDKNTSGTAIFLYLVENALGAIIIGLLVSILIGIIFLILYYMFLSCGLGAVADKIDYLFIIIVIFVILSICTIGGASKGAQSLKEYSWSNLGIQIDELEEAFEKLPLNRKVKIRNKIANSINHILNNEIVDNII